MLKIRLQRLVPPTIRGRTTLQQTNTKLNSTGNMHGKHIRQRLENHQYRIHYEETRHQQTKNEPNLSLVFSSSIARTPSEQEARKTPEKPTLGAVMQRQRIALALMFGSYKLYQMHEPFLMHNIGGQRGLYIIKLARSFAKSCRINLGSSKGIISRNSILTANFKGDRHRMGYRCCCR